MNPEELFVKTLKTNKYSLTNTRTVVFEALQHEEPLSMAELQSKLDGMVDRASLYRTITLFEQLGIVQRLQIGWKYKLELADDFNFHHHHIACKQCGLTLPVREDLTLEASIRTLAMEYGFTEVTHQLEIRGLCPSCQKNLTTA
jgi:Fur family transcriptional regulator, ferric uptake regulator